MVTYFRRGALIFLLVILFPICTKADTVILKGVEYTGVRVLEGSSMYYFRDPASGRTISMRKSLVESGEAQIVRASQAVSLPEENRVIETGKGVLQISQVDEVKIVRETQAVSSPEEKNVIEPKEDAPQTRVSRRPRHARVQASELRRFPPPSLGLKVQKPVEPPRQASPIKNSVLEPEEDAPQMRVSELPRNAPVQASELSQFPAPSLSLKVQKPVEPPRQALPIKISVLEPEEDAPQIRVSELPRNAPVQASGLSQFPAPSLGLKVQKPVEPPRQALPIKNSVLEPEEDAPQISQDTEGPLSLQARFIDGAKDLIQDEEQTFDGMEFVWILPGTFTMGSPSGEKYRRDDERLHEVTISKGFWLSKYEVTQQQWESVMDNNPSTFEGPLNPVERVSWKDCQEFIQRMNNRGDKGYRLPTEAEWEYACRAGSTTDYSFGLSSSGLNDYAWNGDSSGNETHPVGQKKPNPWGLYDMYGNVWEFCQDWKADYPRGSVMDPTGPDRGSRRVRRGGSLLGPSYSYRSALRGSATPQSSDERTGFRLLLPAVR